MLLPLLVAAGCSDEQPGIPKQPLAPYTPIPFDVFQLTDLAVADTLERANGWRRVSYDMNRDGKTDAVAWYQICGTQPFSTSTLPFMMWYSSGKSIEDYDMDGEAEHDLHVPAHAPPCPPEPERPGQSLN